METLANGEVELTLSTRGAVVKAAKMLKYAQNPGPLSEKNPALVLDFGSAPALALEGFAGVEPDADFTVAEKGKARRALASAATAGNRDEIALEGRIAVIAVVDDVRL